MVYYNFLNLEIVDLWLKVNLFSIENHNPYVWVKTQKREHQTWLWTWASGTKNCLIQNSTVALNNRPKSNVCTKRVPFISFAKPSWLKVMSVTYITKTDTVSAMALATCQFSPVSRIDRGIILTQHERIFIKFVNLSNISIPALLKVRKNWKMSLRWRCVTGKNIAWKNAS